MKKVDNHSVQSRRDFLKTIVLTGSAAYLGFGGIFSLAKPRQIQKTNIINFKYQFRTVSVKHVKEVGEWFEKLKAENKIGVNKTFRGYIGNFNFNPKEVYDQAKSLLLVSNPQKLASLTFNHKGKKYIVMIPTGYYDDGVSYELAKEILMDEVVKNTKKTLKEGVKLPVKTMSVRSGLAQYGKNNITFVNEYGSFHQILSFYTDAELEDNWGPLNMLRMCKGCNICKTACPTSCIRDENFVINIDKCVTLYNEIEEPMPDWFPPETHNAFVGCLKCQYTCPANAHLLNKVDNIATLTEDETDFLLGDKKDEIMHKKLIKKLERFPYIKYLDYFRRNLKLVFPNITPV